MRRRSAIQTIWFVLSGVGLAAVDVYVAYGSHAIRTDPFRLLVLLQSQLCLILFLAQFARRRSWGGCFAAAMFVALVGLATCRVAMDHFLFQPSLATALASALLMVVSFSLPCFVCFAAARWRTERRVTLAWATADRRPQFGLRHLFAITAACAVVAFAGRPIVPASLAGQSALAIDGETLATLGLLCLFPGLAAGPMAWATMRPSWRAWWIVPWLSLLIVAEVMAFTWLSGPATMASVTIDGLVAVASSAVPGYIELALGIGLTFIAARLGGVRLVEGE